MGDDPKADLVDLIQTISTLTTEDDAASQYVVTYEFPPKVLLSDYLIGKHLDTVLTVGRVQVTPLRHVQNVPLLYTGDFNVGIWIRDIREGDKDLVIGEKLRWKYIEELRSIFRSNATNQRIKEEVEDDMQVAGVRLYHTILVITHDDVV